MNSIAPLQVACSLHSLATCSPIVPAPATTLHSPTWAALYGAEVGGAAWCLAQPLILMCLMR